MGKLKMSSNMVKTMEKEKKKENGNAYFRPAGDLDLDEKKEENGNAYFRPAGDLDSDEKKSFNIGNDKRSFLASIVSGKSYDDGDIIETGRMILPFDEVVELYEKGYNIISANYFNDLMVDVEFEMKHEKGRGR